MEDRKKNIDTLQSVELGDGVEILLRVAGPFPRSMALIVDYMIIIGLLVVLFFIVVLTTVVSNANIAQGMMLIGLFLLTWGYFAFFEGGKRGATPGKRFLGLRVVDRSGNGASRGQVLVRNLLRFVDMLPGVPSGGAGIMIGGYGAGLVSCLLSKKFQRLGDVVANTVVIYSKSHTQATVTLPPALVKVMPPLTLKREEQAAIVAFRDRAGSWSEARRAELAAHAGEILKSNGGRDGVTELLGMARWLSEGK